VGKRILVVDDDPQVQRLMELTLQRQGYEVDFAATGEEAIRKVITFKPDLVLMDVMMPDMDGFETTKRIRRLPEGHSIPVIFLSALTHMDAKIKGLRVGGTDYVTKPVHLPELLARIEAHLRSSTSPMGKLINIFTSKGGVGGTTLAVNLPFVLREMTQDKEIILVDWQRPQGDVGVLLGLIEPCSLDMLLPSGDAVDEEALAQVLMEYAPGIRVLPGVTDPGLVAKMSVDTLSNILEVALTMADYVIVDMGQILLWDDPPLVTKDIGANICVVTPEITSLRRTLQIQQHVDEEEYDFWLLLNKEAMPGGVQTRQIEAYLGHAMMGKLPYDPATTTRALNVGRPAALSAPRSKFMKALHSVAEHLYKVGEL